MKKLATALVVAGLMTGCNGRIHDLVKDAEGKAYDSIAKAASTYCQPQTKEGTVYKIAEQEAIEFRREIRQRGENGPFGPVVPVDGLDEQTAEGKGPVMIIYCEDDTVPQEVWEDLVRVK